MPEYPEKVKVEQVDDSQNWEEIQKPDIDEICNTEKEKPEYDHYGWYNPVGWVAEPPLKKTISVQEKEEIDELESYGFSDDTKIAGKSWRIFKWYVLKPCNQMDFSQINYLSAKDELLVGRLIKAQIAQGDMYCLKDHRTQYGWYNPIGWVAGGYDSPETENSLLLEIAKQVRSE